MIDFSAVAAVFSAYVVGVALFLSHEAVSGAYAAHRNRSTAHAVP
ncbi:hypothetical protein [Paraburkholderia sp. XV]|nr:hypothetical protein [Paraburkholderia sp. XV]